MIELVIAYEVWAVGHFHENGGDANVDLRINKFANSALHCNVSSLYNCSHIDHFLRKKEITVPR